MRIGKLVVIIAIGCGSGYAWNHLEATHPVKAAIYKAQPNLWGGDKVRLASMKSERDKKQAAMDGLNKQLNTKVYCSRRGSYGYPTLGGTDPRPRWNQEIRDLNLKIYQLEMQLSKK